MKCLYLVGAVAHRFDDSRFFRAFVRGQLMIHAYSLGNEVKYIWRLGLRSGKWFP